MKIVTDACKFYVPGVVGRAFKLPPKVQNVIWMICRDSLPMRQRLNDPRVPYPKNCLLSMDAVEDDAHISLHCNINMQC